jgi:hypothetical protein
MEFLSISDLSKSPKFAFDCLAADGKAIITNNGKPQAIMLKIDDSNFQKTLDMIQQLEFAQSVANMQQESSKNGNDKMTLEEINAEINAARLTGSHV